MSELPSVFTEKYPTARKPHVCCECRRDIAEGTRYQLFKGCWDGHFQDFKTCLPCDELRHACADDGEWPPFEHLAEWATECEFTFPPEK